MRQNSFNVVHLAIALLAVMVIIAILLPMFGSARGKGSRKMQNATQLRGIHQGLVTYGNSNNEFFPGLNAQGEDDRITIEERFRILFEGDFITPEYAISPSETEDFSEWEAGYNDEPEPATPENYSYAMLQVPKDGGRRVEWSQTLNAQAIVLSDRNTGAKAKPSSIHVEPGDKWAGSILWNDNTVRYEKADTFETRYGDGLKDNAKRNSADRLYESSSDDDALLIHAGNEKE